MEIRDAFFNPSLSGDKQPIEGKTHCVLFTSFGMFEINVLMIAGAQQPAGRPEGWGGRDGAQGVRPVRVALRVRGVRGQLRHLQWHPPVCGRQ